MHRVASLIFAVSLFTAVALAQAPHPDMPAAESRPAEPSAAHAAKPEAKPQPPLQGKVEDEHVTHALVQTAAGELAYKATAANMPLKDDSGKLKGTIFFVSYELQDQPKPANGQPPASRPAGEVNPRPVTFVFNGGPGAAAVWLHLGTAGPKRVRLDPESGRPVGPPYSLENNEHTWLDATDLVFIDPVGTGYSRPAEGEKAEQFFGVTEDIRWVADFIRLYITRYGRWLSPIYLAGESYGTTRAAGLSRYLLERYGIALNGIVLVSTVLDFKTLDVDPHNDLPYWLYLPTYAALAQYHRNQGRLDLDALREVDEWAAGPYAVALAAGESLREQDRAEIADALARYTGLPRESVLQSNLRISPEAFRKQLLADQRLVLGRFDGRLTGFDPDPAADAPEYDPSFGEYLAAYSATFTDYARRGLGYESLLPYEVLSSKVRPWNFGESGTGYLNVADDLARAMVRNPRMRVLVASGYYDLATPYRAPSYRLDHLGIGRLRGNIREPVYEGGHMMYHHAGSLAALHEHVAEFMAGWR